MSKTRIIGFGLTIALGLMITAPIKADEACQKALADIDRSMETLNKLQALFDRINQKYTTTTADADAPLKCPACGMMMPTKATDTMTRAVKYGGKTYYCCTGCDMSKTADQGQ